jgi:2-polyprenyl-3-methyl-5-hydroxy-6-metoxy-1,4-benzoquinol methylase
MTPLSDRRAYDRLYNRRYYTDLSTESGSLEIFAELFKRVTVKEGMQVLDIGTGRGELAMLCAERGALVTGIDLSSAAIEMANEKKAAAPPEVRERVSFVVADAATMDLPRGRYDIIFMMDLVEHVWQPVIETLISRAVPALRPTGRLIVHTNPNAFIIKPAFFLANLFLGPRQWESRAYDINEQTYFSLRRSLRSVGLQGVLSMGKTYRFFSQQIRHRSDISDRVKKISVLADRFLDAPLVTALIMKTPLRYFLAADIWLTIRRQDNERFP